MLRYILKIYMGLTEKSKDFAKNLYCKALRAFKALNLSLLFLFLLFRFTNLNV